MNIVLAHGVLGFAKFGGVRYFNGVADRLRSAFSGAAVRACVVPFLGTVETRAHALAADIELGFHEKTEDQDRLDSRKPIHIIAHSMGGLDARLMLARHLLASTRHVSSLTCIGTPHFGSPVATLVNVFNPFQLLSVLRVSGMEQLNDVRAELNAVRDLDEKGARAIDSISPDQHGTDYFEIAGVGRSSSTHTSAFFNIPFSLLALAGVQSDGVVPFDSATRGRTPLDTWAGDHADLVGHDLDRPPAFERGVFDHLAKYEALARRVAT